MADLTIMPRGAGWLAASTVDPTTPCPYDDAGLLGDYVLVVACDDYVPAATNPTAPTCPTVAAWSSLAAAADPASGSTVETIRAWLGKVTTEPGRAGVDPNADTNRIVTVGQSGTSGLHVMTRTLYAGSADGVIALDGTASQIADRLTPYTHPTITPTGTLDLLVCAFGAVQFSGAPIVYTAPAWAGEYATRYHNEFSGLQVATQQLAAATATGTRDQASNVATLAGGAGIRFLLRSQGTAPSTAPTEQSTRFAFAQ